MIDEHNSAGGAGVASGEVSEQLASVSVLLELLLNDRSLQNEESNLGQ